MLLDLDAATLTVYVNGERKGVMVRRGMTSTNMWAGALPEIDNVPGARITKEVARLDGPLRWAVDMYSGVLISIDGPLPLPEEQE